ncbi:YggS family pyridoxal phosphate-dependent enzyme [Legionella dresdenensis]|uniref:Pyridoxal phosphate homeostasis protein n=1 Tax=Legionella dresdenensis TaxID=450200 RepID=A0ABV8CEB7_9GAMM
MSIAKHIAHINQLIRSVALSVQRNPNEITLMAVSKTHDIAAIKQALACGVTDFGENYLQEAENKIAALQKEPITWHFIGSLQSKKTADAACLFAWVHSVDRLKIAQLLSSHRPENMPLLNICIQVNLDEEQNKGGVAPEQLIALAREITALPRIKLRGLMAIPKPVATPEQQYQSLLRLKLLLIRLNQELSLNLDTLSMGMSDDLEAAIKAGSTIVRIGRAIFGERQR